MIVSQRAGLLRSIVRVPMAHVSWKICAPFIALSLFLAAAGTFIATRLVTGSLQERFDNQLAEAARVTSDSIVRVERTHLALVRGVAFTDGVAQRFEAFDSAGLRELAEPVAANGGAEFVELVGADGKRLVGLHRAPGNNKGYEVAPDLVSRKDWAIVANVLGARKDQLGD